MGHQILLFPLSLGFTFSAGEVIPSPDAITGSLVARGDIYPSLLEHVERNMGSSGETLSWALRVIGDLAGAAGEGLKEGVRTDLFELYFDDGAGVDGEASRMMVQVLKGLFSRSMLAEAKSRAKEESPSVRLKGVKLLRELRDCMTSKMIPLKT